MSAKPLPERDGLELTPAEIRERFVQLKADCVRRNPGWFRRVRP